MGQFSHWGLILYGEISSLTLNEWELAGLVSKHWESVYPLLISLVRLSLFRFFLGLFYNFPEQEIRRNGNAWAIIIGITQSQAPIDYLVDFFRAYLRASTRAYRESPWFIQMVASNLVFLLLIASMLSSWNWMPATSLSWYNRLQGISKAYSISVEGTSNHVSRLKIGVRHVMVVHHLDYSHINQIEFWYKY